MAFCVPAQRGLALFATFALLALSFPSRVDAQVCPSGNLLAGARRVGTGLPATTDALNDGRVLPDGSAWNAPGTVVRRGKGPFVVFDLGEPTRIRSALLQGDGNDVYALSVSLDGQRFDGVWGAPALTDPPVGLRTRVSGGFDAVGRFVRVDVIEGDGLAGLSEVQAYCSPTPPEPRPYAVVSAYRTDRSGLRYRMAIATKAAVCFAAIAVVGWLMRRRHATRERLAFVAFTALAAYAFTDLGHFHGGRLRIHPSDSFHYFVGPKYFPELGYFDLYTCVAQAERENGRGADLARFYLRDLHDNRLRPAAAMADPGPRCGGRFSASRWRAFREDVDRYRSLYPQRLPLLRTIADHGYNGTPITTAFHRAFVSSLDATRANVGRMTMIDAASNLVAVLLVGWGLGPIAGILAGFVIAYGEPWGYQWVGGSIGRASFVVWLAAGIALAGRGRRAASAAALAVSGLFRLFPAIFLGVVGLGAIVESVRQRRLSAETRRIVLAAVLTTLGGVLLAGLAVGFDAFPTFFAVMKRHAQNPPGNHLGLPILLHFQPGVDSATLIDGRLTNPLEVWETRLHELALERRPLHLVGVGLSVGVLATALRRRATQVELIGFAGLLLFSMKAMTNYDGVWLLSIVPLVHQRPKRAAALLAFLGSTHLIALWILPMEMRCLVQSALMYALLLYVCLDALRELGQRQLPADDART